MAAEVEFPELRARMTAAVAALAAEPYAPGRNAWGESQFTAIVDALCEELELDRIDVRQAVGFYLKSEDEGRALAELASSLQAVWDEAEKHAADPAFRRTMSCSERRAGRESSSPPAARRTPCFRSAW